MTPALEIPPSQRGALVRLLHLSDEGKRRLLDALREVKPALLGPRFADLLAPKVNLPKGEALDLMMMLAGLYVSMDIAGEPVETFTAAVLDAIRSSSDPQLQMQDADAKQFQTYLAEVLSLDATFGVSAKASDIKTEHDRLFCTVRILTDLRPVFGRDVSKAPAASVIVHEAKITFHEGGEETTKDFYVALDRTDIQELKKVLDRAIRKEESLKTAAAQGGINVLEA